MVFIGFDDDEAIDTLNDEIQKQYDSCIQSVKYKDYSPDVSDFLQEFDFMFFDVYKNDDITSIVQTSNHVLWEAGGFPYQYR